MSKTSWLLSSVWVLLAVLLSDTTKANDLETLVLRSVNQSIQEHQQQQTQPKERHKRIVVYITEGMNYEKETEEALDGLRDKGWVVGKTKDCHIQVIEIAPHEIEKWDRLDELRIGNLPCFIKLWHGCEYERHTGRLTARDISEMYYGRDYSEIVQEKLTQQRELASYSTYTRQEADQYLQQNYGVSVYEVEERFGQPIEELAEQYGIRIEGQNKASIRQDRYRRGYQAPVQFERSDCAT